MEGSGLMLVCAVGIHTQLGQSKLKLQEDPEITPLQLKLETVVDQITGVGEWCAYLTFAGMTIHLVIEKLYLGVSLYKQYFLSNTFVLLGTNIRNEHCESFLRVFYYWCYNHRRGYPRRSSSCCYDSPCLFRGQNEG